MLLRLPDAGIRTGSAAAWSAGIVLGFLIVYVALDWVSYIEPFNTFGITPWNPAAGFALAFGLLAGTRYLWLLPITPLLAELIVRQLPASLPVLAGQSLAIGLTYSAAIVLLTRPDRDFRPSLQRLRDVSLLSGFAIATTAVVSAIYVGILVGAQRVEARDFLTAAMRYWIGDLIGILVTTPLLLLYASIRRIPAPSLETIAQVGLAAVALYMIFRTGGAPHVELFYLLFLPITWMALRGGLYTVSMGLAATQVLLVLAIQTLASERPHFASLQAMMLVLALTGLAIGVVVDERRRAEIRVRAMQDAQARLTRLASFNELSAAIAHEINQPLSAATTYARIAIEALQAGSGADGDTAARTAAQKSMAQVQRAAEVVRRIRQLMRSGLSEPTAVAVAPLIRDAIELAGIERFAAGCDVTVDVQPAGLLARADELQTQQVLINLLRNAAEAVSEVGEAARQISITVGRDGEGMVAFVLQDTGPGFRKEQLEEPFQPFVTTKLDGLGIGLSLCRTIIEANGGRLSIANTRRGAQVRFSLPEAVEVG